MDQQLGVLESGVFKRNSLALVLRPYSQSISLPLGEHLFPQLYLKGKQSSNSGFLKTLLCIISGNSQQLKTPGQQMLQLQNSSKRCFSLKPILQGLGFLFQTAMGVMRPQILCIYATSIIYTSYSYHLIALIYSNPWIYQSSLPSKANTGRKLDI